MAGARSGWRRPREQRHGRRAAPQRLGQLTWRDRIEANRRTCGSRSDGRRWFGRLAGAGLLAVVATVVLAMTAVYLTGPRTDRGAVGASRSPSTGASPLAPLAPATTGGIDVGSVVNVVYAEHKEILSSITHPLAGLKPNIIRIF